MKAFVQSVRIAPKKANLIAKMVRNMSVPDAMEALRRTHKKGARIVETLLRSAIANASHNDKQDAQTMVIKSIVVNQGQAYRRGVPMARGRTRPMRKFLSHISLELGFPEIEETPKKSTKKASQKPKNEVQKGHTSSKNQTGKASAKKDSPDASASPVSTES